MKRYKTEIILNQEQIQKFNKTIGVCRFIYNLFIDKNKELLKESDSQKTSNFMNAYGFGVWLNNYYIPNHPGRLSKKYKIANKKSSNSNINKQKVKIQKIYQKISNIYNDYQNKVIQDIIKQEPNFITIENLNIKGMMKNRHLSRAIQNQGLYRFIEKLKYKCLLNGIELRQVDRFFASSKTCSVCGLINKDLKLKDRIYKCECGNIIDRDINAAINLKNAKNYKVLL